MPLPTLETPTYELILPSTEEKITYRPFLVKEYKVLLTALESDVEEIHRIVNDLISACTFNKLKANELPTFDTEYLFLNIRARSIGEITNLTVKCENCSEKIEVEMDVTKADIEKDAEHTRKIQIDKNVMVEMRYPSFKEMLDIYENFQSEKIVEMLSKCISGVYTEDEYITEFTHEELLNFVNSFSKEQFEKIEKFFLTMPKVSQQIEKECTSCKHLNKVKLEGLQNFFA